MRGIPRSPVALPGRTPVQGIEDDPHDEDQREDEQVNHYPSRGIWLAWLIVSHDHSSSLALKYRSIFRAYRIGAEHRVQGRDGWVLSTHKGVAAWDDVEFEALAVVDTDHCCRRARSRTYAPETRWYASPAAPDAGMAPVRPCAHPAVRRLTWWACCWPVRVVQDGPSRRWICT